jgi:outer membrane PBP1 activator LpoA protein
VRDEVAAQRARGNPGSSRVLTQADIEEAIARLEAELEEATHIFADLCDEEADAEADWKGALWRATVELAAKAEGRSNEKLREAQASLQAGEELFRLYRVAAGRVRSTGAALGALRARLDAYRTLSANVRSQT